MDSLKVRLTLLPENRGFSRSFSQLVSKADQASLDGSFRSQQQLQIGDLGHL